ncbi:eukaryotic translation initiation factor 4E-binding protein 3-like [Poecilia latipinna]|uniref:Eukaryotic translation initiation factor 4E binding protein 3, like n=2 Tax=Poecilia TaxID=8080 RepID=A0A087XPA3_POEFO|nr:PREDICTED: eukaryotic translation initiation factor 4E-binding protein 3 [Poecilia formosa]XP_014825250.1 PREDICTED: eukaryotic translation initiation factor 4E-binding protein 3 [Poecilia mexicana]XP_014914820.1 PREDICTED: eukaryotic translation initiation factor 4E-binding protein 3 [Poecilia latipinna]
MSTGTKQVKSCPIPTKVLTLKDWSQLPDCYSQTPGGTLFSTTPGGTRIIYDRKFLLDCRNSPLARTPPCCLPQIPGVTVPATHAHHTGKLQDLKEEAEEEEKDIGDDSQFEMDI